MSNEKRQDYIEFKGVRYMTRAGLKGTNPYPLGIRIAVTSAGGAISGVVVGLDVMRRVALVEYAVEGQAPVYGTLTYDGIELLQGAGNVPDSIGYEAQEDDIQTDYYEANIWQKLKENPALLEKLKQNPPADNPTVYRGDWQIFFSYAELPAVFTCQHCGKEGERHELKTQAFSEGRGSLAMREGDNYLCPACDTLLFKLVRLMS